MNRSLPDAGLFAALGDPTRLGLIERLRQEGELSTAALARGLPLSRQAVDKHLDVLLAAGLVQSRREGRARRWAVDAAPLEALHGWAARYRPLWEARLDRLDAFLLGAPDPEGAARQGPPEGGG